jgi:hypothetical protein
LRIICKKTHIHWTINTQQKLACDGILTRW